jgi:glycosyltransferase involved in cell wall biosynthesis
MLLLSSREGFPVTIAEAMASGLPTVTVDLPDNGGAQIVEQYDAGLVAAADASAIADAVEKILSDRQSWTERCLRNAAGLEWTVLADALLKQVQL